MNFSELPLYGISPLFDQTLLVRCHICQFVIKLPQLTEHLSKRHDITSSEQLIDKAASLSSSNSTSTTNSNSNLNDNASVSSSSSSCSTSSLNWPLFNTDSNNTSKKSNINRKASLLKHQQASLSEKTKNTKKSSKTSLIKSNSTSELNSIGKLDNNDSVKYKYVVEKIKSKLNSNKTNSTSSTNGAGTTQSLLTPIPLNQLNIAPLPPKFSSPSAQNGVDVNASDCDLETSTSISENTTIANNSNGSSLSSLINSDSNKLNRNDSQNVNSNNGNSNSITNATKLHNNKNAHKASKEYDPDKHCGVVVEQTDPITGIKILSEPCTRSLTCKKHPINLRRQVFGRTKTFNELFKLYRDEKLTNVNTESPNSKNLFNESVPSNLSQLSNQSDSTATQSQIETASTVPRRKGPRKNSKTLSDSNLNTTKNKPKLLVDESTLNSALNANNNDLQTSDNLSLNQTIPFSTNNFSYTTSYDPNNINHQNDYSKSLIYQNSNDIYHQKPSMIHNQLKTKQPVNNNNPSILSLSASSSSSLNSSFNRTNSTLINDNFSYNNNDNNYNNHYMNQPQQGFNQPAQINAQQPIEPSYDSIIPKLNLNYANQMVVKHHPRPSAVSSFNARLTNNGGGYTLWNRRQDNLRLLLTNAFNQSESFLPKNRSFTQPINQFVSSSPYKFNYDQSVNNLNGSLAANFDSFLNQNNHHHSINNSSNLNNDFLSQALKKASSDANHDTNSYINHHNSHSFLSENGAYLNGDGLNSFLNTNSSNTSINNSNAFENENGYFKTNDFINTDQLINPYQDANKEHLASTSFINGMNDASYTNQSQNASLKRSLSSTLTTLVTSKTLNKTNDYLTDNYDNGYSNGNGNTSLVSSFCSPAETYQTNKYMKYNSGSANINHNYQTHELTGAKISSQFKPNAINNSSNMLTSSISLSPSPSSSSSASSSSISNGLMNTNNINQLVVNNFQIDST